MQENINKQPKTWLQKLKDESWEAELLISTIAIFGTFQLFKILDFTINFIVNTLPPSQYLIGYGIVFGGLIAVSILMTMFIIHFLLRAYWVGLVGLNSVFPDYSLEDSAYSEIYTKKILSLLPHIEQTIEDVDELSSVIFSAAFTTMFIYAYSSIVAGILLLLYNILVDYVSHTILLIPLGILVLLLTFQTLFSIIANIKGFKQNQVIQSLYFTSVKWGSIAMFGPFYKNILQVTMIFGSNFKKKKAMTGLVIVFILVGFGISIFQFTNSRLPYLINKDFLYNETIVYNAYYTSRTTDSEFLLTPQIDSDIQESKIFQLFIPIYRYERKMLKNRCGNVVEQSDLKRKWYLDCYSKYNEVLLNDRKINPDFIKYYHPETGQFGIISYIDLENETKGKNTLQIKKYLDHDTMCWEIPFHYVPLGN